VLHGILAPQGRHPDQREGRGKEERARHSSERESCRSTAQRPDDELTARARHFGGMGAISPRFRPPGIPTGLPRLTPRYLTGIAEIALRFRPPGYW